MHGIDIYKIDLGYEATGKNMFGVPYSGIGYTVNEAVLECLNLILEDARTAVTESNMRRVRVLKELGIYKTRKQELEEIKASAMAKAEADNG